jgi:hypothetical protein
MNTYADKVLFVGATTSCTDELPPRVAKLFQRRCLATQRASTLLHFSQHTRQTSSSSSSIGRTDPLVCSLFVPSQSLVAVLCLRSVASLVLSRRLTATSCLCTTTCPTRVGSCLFDVECFFHLDSRLLHIYFTSTLRLLHVSTLQVAVAKGQPKGTV